MANVARPAVPASDFAGRSEPPGPPPRRIVGLIPAAGRATRLGDIPCSKELLPVGFQVGERDGYPEPKPVSQYLVEQMKRAGCTQVFFILRRGKWDIADYFQDGQLFGMDVGYLMAREPWGPPFTLNQATSFVADATVAVGFPDIVVHPQDALAQTVARLHATDADVVVGTFPAREEDCCDFVQTDANGRVVRLIPKEDGPDWGERRTTWLLAAWGPRFTTFLSERVRQLAQIAQALRDGGGAGREPEWPVGAVIASALEAGLAVDSVHFAHGIFLDIGAPDQPIDAMRFPGVWDGRTTPSP